MKQIISKKSFRETNDNAIIAMITREKIFDIEILSTQFDTIIGIPFIP